MCCGGFADDDSHVGLLVSHPKLHADRNHEAVRTKQVAPTILRALGIPADQLDDVRAEHTEALSGLRFAR